MVPLSIMYSHICFYVGVSEKASFITPVPGGVGPCTVAMLMRNTLLAYKKEISFSDIAQILAESDTGKYFIHFMYTVNTHILPNISIG